MISLFSLHVFAAENTVTTETTGKKTAEELSAKTEEENTGKVGKETADKAEEETAGKTEEKTTGKTKEETDSKEKEETDSKKKEEADSKKKEETDSKTEEESIEKIKKELAVPCLEQIDAIESGRKITTFGGLTLDANLQRILTDAVRQLRSKGYHLGFVMVDIKSGQGIAYHPDKVFYSASTVKGFYVAAMTDCYPDSFAENYDMIADVLIYSDNEEYGYLWNAYGSDCMERWAKIAGVKDVDWASDMYTDYTARDLAKLWLLNYAYFESKRVPKELPKLYESPQMCRIHAVLGEKYKTRSKAGWIPTYYDCPTYDDGGIIYVKGSPYIIAIASDIPEEYMEQTDGLIRLLDVIHRVTQ